MIPKSRKRPSPPAPEPPLARKPQAPAATPAKVLPPVSKPVPPAAVKPAKASTQATAKVPPQPSVAPLPKVPAAKLPVAAPKPAPKAPTVGKTKPVADKGVSAVAQSVPAPAVAAAPVKKAAAPTKVSKIAPAPPAPVIPKPVAKKVPAKLVAAPKPKAAAQSPLPIPASVVAKSAPIKPTQVPAVIAVKPASPARVPAGRVRSAPKPTKAKNAAKPSRPPAKSPAKAVAKTTAAPKPADVPAKWPNPLPVAELAVPEPVATPSAKTSIAEELMRRVPELFADGPRSKTARVLPSIPAILLDGDRPGLPPGRVDSSLIQGLASPEAEVAAWAAGAVSAPAGPRSDSAPVPTPAHVSVPPPSGGTVGAFPAIPVAEFPGQGSLWLTARDPFCVCAHWQFAGAAQDAFAQAHPGGAWWLRLRASSASGWLINEQRLPRDADFRFVPVTMAGSTYVAEVGYRFADGGWRGLALSAPAHTPPDAPAESFAEAEVVRLPPAPVTPDSLPTTPPDHPEPVVHPVFRPAPLPTPRQAQRLTELVWEPVLRREAPSSAEVAEWELRKVETEVPGETGLDQWARPTPTSGELTGSSGLSPGADAPSSEALASPAPAVPPDFWFKVNAELIIYGSTERDAQVTIAGRTVALRPDGSFSFRFALPDGDFTLPAIAVNAAGTDGRAAQLRFTRATVLTGEVGVHPQDAKLKPPVAEAIA